MDKKEKTGVLNVRDLVNVGLFSVLIFIATFLSGMIGFIPVLMPVVPFVYGIVSGPVYMLYFTKIKKAGMLFIQTIVVTLAFVATGHGPWVLLTAVIGGLLGEVVLRNGRYKSVKHARLAFSVQSIYGLGNWLPIYFARDAYIRQMLDMGYGEEYTQKMMSVLPNWTLPLIVILGMLGAYIGCTIGIRMLKKHFVKQAWQRRYSVHSEKFKLDFRTKMLMSLCLSYTLILGNIQTKFSIVAAAYSLLPYVFLLLNREKKAAVKGILFIMAAYIIQKEWVFSAGGFLGSLFLFITMMFLRLLPGFVMARFALASSTMSHMTSALKKMHFPVVLIIPITVMARFFHTAREDYNQVKDAMYLHGLTNRRLFFHPVKLFEYRMVPLFMVLTKTADDVAVSAMTRGLKIHGKRTYIGESRFCMRDYICFLLMLVLIGFYIGGKYVCV